MTAYIVRSLRGFPFRMGKRRQDKKSNKSETQSSTISSQPGANLDTLQNGCVHRDSVFVDNLIDSLLTMNGSLGQLKCPQDCKSSSNYTASTLSSNSSLSSSSSTPNRTDLHNFVHSFPLRYALGIHNPSDILLHMTMLEDVKIHGPHFSSVHISSELSHFSTSLGYSLNDMSNNSSHAYSMHSSTHSESSSHHSRHIKAVTIVCPQTTGLLEFIIGLWEAGGSDILDCNIVVSKERIVLVSFIYIFISFESCYMELQTLTCDVSLHSSPDSSYH